MHSLFLNFSFSVSSNKSFGDKLEDFIKDGGGIVVNLVIFILIGLAIGIPITVIIWARCVKKNNDNILGVNDLYAHSRITINAKVISKRDFQVNAGMPDPFHHIMFECEDGLRLDFAFQRTDERYNTIFVGDKGSLTYAGKAFVDFQRIVDARQSQ